MSLTDFDSSFKWVAELMPRYDGNPKTLNYFIREVENIIGLIAAPPGSQTQPASHPALLCLIKSRLSGTAIDAIAYEENCSTWAQIKEALVRRLGEPRNEIQLMQELTRLKRNRSEDADMYGRKIREILDTLFSVGKHSDKSYYENMAIEQYINQLEFHVGIGVRIAKPETLELAIVAARQEEARVRANRNIPLEGQSTSKFRMDTPRMPFRPASYHPPRNSIMPEQQQTPMHSALPWKNRPGSGNYRQSGNFRYFSNRQQPNIPQVQSPQRNPPQKVSDVTMRSVNKPPTPQFTPQQFFHMSHGHQPDDEAEYSYNGNGYEMMENSETEENASYTQNFLREPQNHDQR